jgi:hypothetical protein
MRTAAAEPDTDKHNDALPSVVLYPACEFVRPGRSLQAFMGGISRWTEARIVKLPGFPAPVLLRVNGDTPIRGWLREDLVDWLRRQQQPNTRGRKPRAAGNAK